MTYIIRKPDGTIKTYLEFIHDTRLEDGETFSYTPLSMEEYANLFLLSYQSIPCCSVQVPVNSAPVQIDVNAPGCSDISININGVPQIVVLTDGKGFFILPTDSPAQFRLAPADQTAFCAAGNGSLFIEIL